MSWGDAELAPLVLEALFAASWKGGAVVVLVLALRALLGKLLSPRWRYALWSVVAVRLLLPHGPPNPLSLFRWTPIPTGRPLFAVDAAGPAGEAARAAGALAPSAEIPWAILLLALWAGVAGALIVRLAADRRQRSRLLRAASPIRDRSTLELLDRCRREIGIGRPVELLRTADLAGPALLTGRRSAILLPANPSTPRGGDDLRHVLLHELAHLRNRDGGLELLTRWLTILHWFNPLVHLAARRARADREAACDQRVLDILKPHERPAYGRSLIRAATSAATRPLEIGLLGMTSQPSNVRRRIEMIARHDTHHRRFTPYFAALLLALAALGWTDVSGLAQASSSAGTAPALAEDDKKQEATIVRTRTSGVAIYRMVEAEWGEEHFASWHAQNEELAAEPDESGVFFVDWRNCPAISHRELSALLVPKYIEELPATDGWGHRLEFCFSKSFDGRHLMGVRSPGRDGEFSGDEYPVGGFPHDRVDRDVVWMDGYYVTWPVKK